MKTRLLLPLLALICFSFTFPYLEFTTLEIGKSIPKSDVKMMDVSGKEISLSEAKGKNGLLVMFSCNTCPFVVKNESRTKEVTDFAQKNGFGVVVINSNQAYRNADDSFEAMKKYKAEKQFSGYYVVDENSVLADAFGASHTPETFLFDKNGLLVYKGAIDDSPRDEKAVTQHYLKDALEACMKGTPISINSTKSIGCSIKRKDS